MIGFHGELGEWPDLNLRIEQEGTGVKVTQDGHEHIALDWRLSNEVKKIIQVSIDAGLPVLVHPGNPKAIKLDNGKSQHASKKFFFKESLEGPWIFVIDEQCNIGSAKPERVVFNKKVMQCLSISGDKESRVTGNFFVDIQKFYFIMANPPTWSF